MEKEPKKKEEQQPPKPNPPKPKRKYTKKKDLLKGIIVTRQPFIVNFD